MTPAGQDGDRGIWPALESVGLGLERGSEPATTIRLACLGCWRQSEWLRCMLPELMTRPEGTAIQIPRQHRIHRSILSILETRTHPTGWRLLGVQATPVVEIGAETMPSAQSQILCSPPQEMECFVYGRSYPCSRTTRVTHRLQTICCSRCILERHSGKEWRRL